MKLWDNGLTETCMCHQSHLASNHIGAIMPSTNIYWILQKQFNYTGLPEFEGLVKRFGALPNDSNIYWIPFKQHSSLGRSETRTPLTHLYHSVIVRTATHFGQSFSYSAYYNSYKYYH